MYRRSAYPDPLPEWYYRMPVFDWPTVVLLAQQSPAMYLPEVMSAYRIHDGGVWSGLPPSETSDHLARAMEMLLRHVDSSSPAINDSRARLHQKLFSRYVEQEDYRSASRHAASLLVHMLRKKLTGLRVLSRSEAVQMGWWLSTILRARSPQLWRALRRIALRG